MIISGNRDLFDSIRVKALPAWILGNTEREVGLYCFIVLVVKKTVAGGKSSGACSYCL